MVKREKESRPFAYNVLGSISSTGKGVGVGIWASWTTRKGIMQMVDVWTRTCSVPG